MSKCICLGRCSRRILHWTSGIITPQECPEHASNQALAHLHWMRKEIWWYLACRDSRSAHCCFALGQDCNGVIGQQKHCVLSAYQKSTALACCRSCRFPSPVDDTYDGYCIPKSFVIMPNTRKIQFFMLNDLQIYAKPSQFEPDRFLVKNGKRLRLTLAWSASAFVDVSV